MISEAKNSFLEPLLLENTIKNNALKRVKKQSASILVTNGFTARATASITGCSISTVIRSHRYMMKSGDIKDLPRSGCTGIYSETFIFRNHVATCSATEEIHDVMDNLSTHRGYPFWKVVAELSNVKCPTEKELDNMEKRVNFLKSADKRIVIHFTPYHGSWLDW